jgi:hypothetical protein
LRFRHQDIPPSLSEVEGAGVLARIEPDICRES